MNMLLPEMATSRPVLLALAAHAHTASRHAANAHSKDRPSQITRWCNFVKKSDGWVQCWTVPILSTVINYTYHPMPLPGPVAQANVPTPEREEMLLTPVRLPPINSSLKIPKAGGRSHLVSDFDPTSLPPDLVNVEVEFGPSELYVYGTVLRTFLHLKVCSICSSTLHSLEESFD